ncbi:hypothetical protein EPUL_003639, partial [Erysiphe pulchra]
MDFNDSLTITATTPGINVDPSVTFDPYLRNRSNALKGKPSILTQELLLHSSNHPKLDYVAKEEDAGGSNALLKHYVGIYDPDTGKLEIVEARSMVIRGILRAQQCDEDDEKSHNSLREQRNILGRTFGTKKARKAIASITENAISPSLTLRNTDGSHQVNLATAVMLSNVAEATKDMKSREDLFKAADDVKPRPKANMDAKNIEDIYTIESLIGTDVLKAIPVREWQNKARAREEIFVRSKFVANRIQDCANSVEKLKILRFMLMLLEIYGKSRKSKEGRKLPRKEQLNVLIGDIPDVVIAAAKKKFTENDLIKKYHCDFLITHLCAMSLLVDDFQTDTYDLREDLQLDLAQISKYFSEIGVKSHVLGANDVSRYGKATASQRRIAKLKLPLKFPKFSYEGRR